MISFSHGISSAVSRSWENPYIIVNLDVHMVLALIMVVKIYNPLSVSRNPNRPLLLKLACSRSVLFSEWTVILPYGISTQPAPPHPLSWRGQRIETESMEVLRGLAGAPGPANVLPDRLDELLLLDVVSADLRTRNLQGSGHLASPLPPLLGGLGRALIADLKHFSTTSLQSNLQHRQPSLTGSDGSSLMALSRESTLSTTWSMLWSLANSGRHLRWSGSPRKPSAVMPSSRQSWRAMAPWLR